MTQLNLSWVYTQKPLSLITETLVHTCLLTMAKKWNTLDVHQQMSRQGKHGAHDAH